jgi:ATP-dependent Clp protease ATP-binding subunit ClpA
MSYMPRKNENNDNKPAEPKTPVAGTGRKPKASENRSEPQAEEQIQVPRTRSRKSAVASAGAGAGADPSPEAGTGGGGSGSNGGIITGIEANIPVVIPPGARSPVDDIIEVLRREVIGQDRAIDAIARALLRSREGFRTPAQPISVMFFAGPTGVGKTETVRALAKALHNDWRAVLKIDCSEYAEPHSIARLIGAPPGYIGSDLPAILAKENVEGVKNRLILFDEVEKAHYRLHNLLLQIMDEGHVTLARRTKEDDGSVSFEDCIVIMTSNVGAGEIDAILHASRIGFRSANEVESARTDQQVYEAVKEAMKKRFAPEFRNRIKEFIVFRALERPNLYRILQKLLNISATRFASLGFQLTLTTGARDYLVDRGQSSELGVRPLVRAVEKYIDTKVAELHAYGLIKEGDVLEADVVDTSEHLADGRMKQEIVFFRAARKEEGAGSSPRKKPRKTEIKLERY